MTLQQVWVPSRVHKRVKKFAAEQRIDIKEAYDQLIFFLLDETGEINSKTLEGEFRIFIQERRKTFLRR